MTWRAKLFEKRFYYLVGLAGINPQESRGVRRCGNVFSGLMIVVAVLLLVEWQLQLLREIDESTSFIINWVIFVFFVTTFVVELLIVKDRWQYVRQNWALPLIIIGGLPFIIEYKSLMQPLSALRPLLAIYILFPSLRTLINFFFDGDLRTTVLGAAVVVVIFGILVAGIDPNIENVWDGIWWAIATVATVGYGDVVPASPLGRLLGAILVVLGVAIFVIITANILAFTLRKETTQFKTGEKHIDEILDELKEMKKTQQKQTQLLKKLEKKFNKKKK